MKSILVIVLSMILTTGVANAKEKSAKKASADSIDFAPPQVLEQNDNLAGLRVGMGSAFEGTTVLGFSYERMITPYVGLSGQIHYADYHTNFYGGQWGYTAWTFAFLANAHADVFHAKNLDTYLSGGIGHSVLSSKWKTTTGLPAPGNADSDATFLVAYINARYFLNSQWGISAALGTGLGTLQLGVDYVY